MKLSKQKRNLAKLMSRMSAKQLWAFYKKREYFLDRQKDAYVKTGNTRTLILIQTMQDNVNFIHDRAVEAYQRLYPKRKPEYTPRAPAPEPKYDYSNAASKAGERELFYFKRIKGEDDFERVYKPAASNLVPASRLPSVSLR